MTPDTLIASRYRLRRRAGRGGMGEVWVGFDTVLGREVAVKLVNLAAGDDPVAAERFRREALATAALSHENVVTIFDAGTDGSTAFIVMELLPGPTLAGLLKDRAPLAIDRALELAEQIAAALAATHLVGVIHRDIKPSNLMLDGTGRLKVVDFGIARLAESTAQLTATSTVVGSATYMAPEQAAGQPASPGTDLYALGCVLMALLTGRPPFEGEHPLSILQQHMNTAPPRIRDRRPDAPPGVDNLVHQLLAKAPEHRPVDAGQVRDRITALRSSIDSTAPFPATQVATEVLTRPSGEATRVLPPPQIAAADASTNPTSRGRWSNRRLLAAGLAGTVALIGAMLLAPWLFGSPDPSEQNAARSPAAKSRSPQITPDSNTTTEAGSPNGQSSSPTTVAEALNQLRDTITAAQTSGDADPKALDDLLHRADDIEKQLADGHTQDLGKKLDDFDHRLDDLIREGKLTTEGATSIRQALTEVRTHLP